MRGTRWVASAALVWLAGCSGTDSVSGASATEVARIVMSASTNAAEVDVVVDSDGSAARSIGPIHGALSDSPATFPPGSPEGLAFLADLMAVGDVSQIPIGLCAKSISFGTTTEVTAAGKTSGDLQCLQDPTPAASALAADANALIDDTP